MFDNLSDHPIPFFCPKALIDYRSQELMPFLQNQNRVTIEELRIEPGDSSRRLDQAMLEDSWAVEFHETLADPPIWAKGDAVLQKILHASRLHAKEAHSMQSPPRSRSSSLTAHGTEDTTLSGPTQFSPPLAEFNWESLLYPLPMDEKPMPGGINSAQSPSMKRQPSRGMKPSVPRYSAENPQKIRKPRLRKNGRGPAAHIRKVALNPARGTRSHREIRLYELDRNSIAIDVTYG